jgi:hypothetical protein
MLEIGTSGLMSGEEKRVVILLLGDLIPRSFSTLPNSSCQRSSAAERWSQWFCGPDPPASTGVPYSNFTFSRQSGDMETRGAAKGLLLLEIRLGCHA